MKGVRGGFRTLPREAARPHRNQKNALKWRQSHTIPSSHLAHQGAAISQVRGTRSRPEDATDEHPGLSQLNTLFVHEAAPESP